MAASLKHIDAHTSMGANLIDGGATFRTWAPRASAVYVLGDVNGRAIDSANLLTRDERGYWAGFFPGVVDGCRYRFQVVGAAGEGSKRDPCARELGAGWPDCDSIVRGPTHYPWHDAQFRSPAFNDLVIYQLHIGVFYALARPDEQEARLNPGGTFLDFLFKLEYLADLGINAVEPLPIIEFETDRSMGYNGADLFAPDERYTVPLARLEPYVTKVNSLLNAKGHAPISRSELEGHVNQLKAFVDLCHLYGIAAILDVVYNHAGGGFNGPFGFDPNSIYFFDCQNRSTNNNSLYFTDQQYAGGLRFAYWQDPVAQFLIDNAGFWVDEYHVDGLRYDEVTQIVSSGGEALCFNLVDTLHARWPNAINIAEFWGDKGWITRPRADGGAAFDAVWQDNLRDNLRQVCSTASAGETVRLNLDPVRDALNKPVGFSAAWKSVQHLENHDIVYGAHGGMRIARLCDPSDGRSWYARSRARVATGILLTSPGIPMMFMGEEFLEDKPWSDTDPRLLIWWEGLDRQKVMADFLRYTRELIRVRRRCPALRGEGIHAYKVDDGSRVLAYQRWVENVGRDVVVVASFNEATYWNYSLGFPRSGRWLEVFNSDVYDNWVNPWTAGNRGAIVADGPPLDELPASASIVIPANGLVIFALDGGD